jgi:hypothetical protein
VNNIDIKANNTGIMKPNNQPANSISHVDTLWKQLIQRQAQRRPGGSSTNEEDDNDMPLSNFLETAIELSTASLQEEARVRGANSSVVDFVSASQEQRRAETTSDTAGTASTTTTAATTTTTKNSMEGR